MDCRGTSVKNAGISEFSSSNRTDNCVIDMKL
jgi:hypothetical protein